MDSQSRIKFAISHKEPDRVPLDLGGIVSGITQGAYRRLSAYLGLSLPETLIDRSQRLVKPNPEILSRFGIDTRYAYLEIPPQLWTDDKKGSIWEDEWGVKRRFTGLYYDMIEHPLANLETVEDLKKVKIPPPPDDEQCLKLKEEVNSIRSQGKAAIINIIGSCFEFAWYLRGLENFLTDLVLHPSLACGIMDLMLEYQFAQFDQLLNHMGSLVDIVLCGDDLATQKGPLISPNLYQRYVKPRQKKLYDFIKKRTKAKIFYHSCGAITPFLPDLIEIGVDIINPIQVSAEGMDPTRLKRDWGKDLTFWGGIDTQRVLPQGTPTEVREEVRKRIDQLAQDGGYILCAVHNLQADVPPQNIVAMYEEALTYGNY